MELLLLVNASAVLYNVADLSFLFFLSITTVLLLGIRALMHDVISSPDLIDDVIVWKKGGVFEPWRIAHTYHDTNRTTSIAEQCQPGVKELVFEKRSRRQGVGSSSRGNFTVTQAILMPDTKDWKPADQGTMKYIHV